MITFHTYGIPETREFASIHKEESGEMRWSDIKPPGKYLLDDPIAPWNLPNATSSNSFEYSNFLWTPPLIVEIIKNPQPVCDNITQIAEPIHVWTDTSCTRDWVVRDLTTEEQAAAARKIWPNTQAFLAEFTVAEMAGIGLSTDPTIAALRVMLSVWSGQIYSDDERVVTGLAALHLAGILSARRRMDITTK